MLHKRIFIIYPADCEYVKQRMTYDTPCVAEYQHETELAAWSHFCANRVACGLSADMSGSVAVECIGTGETNARGVPMFRPTWLTDI